MIPSSTFRTERDARTTDGDAIGAAATQAPFAIFFCVFDSDALACGSKRSLAGGFWDLALNQAPGHFSFQHSENLPEHPTQRRVPEPYNCTLYGQPVLYHLALFTRGFLLRFSPSCGQLEHYNASDRIASRPLLFGANEEIMTSLEKRQRIIPSLCLLCNGIHTLPECCPRTFAAFVLAGVLAGDALACGSKRMAELGRRVLGFSPESSA